MEEEIINEEEEQEEACEDCGACHIDGWEAMACWSFLNDPDYDPWEI